MMMDKVIVNSKFFVIIQVAHQIGITTVLLLNSYNFLIFNNRL